MLKVVAFPFEAISVFSFGFCFSISIDSKLYRSSLFLQRFKTLKLLVIPECIQINLKILHYFYQFPYYGLQLVGTFDVKSPLYRKCSDQQNKYTYSIPMTFASNPSAHFLLLLKLSDTFLLVYVGVIAT